MPKAKTKHTTAKKTDPMLGLIDTARRRIHDLCQAVDAHAKLEDKLGVTISMRTALVIGPRWFDQLFNRSYFYNIKEIDDAQTAATTRLRAVIADETKKLKGKAKLSASEEHTSRTGIARAKFEMTQIAPAVEWLKREYQSDRAMLDRASRKSGYAKTRNAEIAAEVDALLAVRALSKVKPATIDGAIALVKFVADANKAGDSWHVEIDGELDLGEALHQALTWMPVAA
jgi:hypothetical protein